MLSDDTLQTPARQSSVVGLKPGRTGCLVISAVLNNVQPTHLQSLESSTLPATRLVKLANSVEEKKVFNPGEPH